MEEKGLLLERGIGPLKGKLVPGAVRFFRGCSREKKEQGEKNQRKAK